MIFFGYFQTHSGWCVAEQWSGAGAGW